MYDAWYGGKHVVDSNEYAKSAITKKQYDEYGYDGLLRFISTS